MKVNKICNQQNGYTLIEVLATLVIFFIIISIVSVTLVQILNNVDSIKQKEQRLTSIQEMITIFQFDLSQVTAKVTQSDTNKNQLLGTFYTKNNILHFYKSGYINPGYEYNRSSLEEVEYRLDKQQLIRLSKTDNEKSYRTQVILDNVSDFKWVLYDKKLSQYTNWPPTQDWQFLTPTAIKLEVNLKDLGQIVQIVDMASHE